MMRPKGVQSVLRGMLDSPGEGQGKFNTSNFEKIKKSEKSDFSMYCSLAKLTKQKMDTSVIWISFPDTVMTLSFFGQIGVGKQCRPRSDCS